MKNAIAAAKQAQAAEQQANDIGEIKERLTAMGQQLKLMAGILERLDPAKPDAGPAEEPKAKHLPKVK